MSALSEHVQSGDYTSSLPPRLVIAPFIANKYVCEGRLSWSHHQWNLASHLMGWTDWRLAASADWHGLAIVTPELTAEQLYHRTNFEEAWTSWALCDSHFHEVAVTVRDEYSEREFEFGNRCPKLHATINVFTREFFEEHDPGNNTLVWERIFTAMAPGCDASITEKKSLEQWLSDGEVTLPLIWMDQNPRPYEEVVVLKYGKLTPQPVGYKLEHTGNKPLA